MFNPDKPVQTRENVMWLNIGTNKNGRKHIQSSHQSWFGADKAKLDNRTECIRVEFKEGQFDE